PQPGPQGAGGGVERVGPIGAEYVVAERVAPPVHVVHEERRRHAQLGHAGEVPGVGQGAVLDAVPTVGPSTDGLVGVQHLVEGSVAVGVHHELPALGFGPGHALAQVGGAVVGDPAVVGAQV